MCILVPVLLWHFICTNYLQWCRKYSFFAILDFALYLVQIWHMTKNFLSELHLVKVLFGKNLGKNLKALKSPQPCKEINTIFYHLNIFQGLIFNRISCRSVSSNISLVVWDEFSEQHQYQIIKKAQYLMPK